MDPTTLTLIELRDTLAEGGVTAEAATRAYLDRIEAHDGSLHTCNEVYAERALDRARRADATFFPSKLTI